MVCCLQSIVNQICLSHHCSYAECLFSILLSLSILNFPQCNPNRPKVLCASIWLSQMNLKAFLGQFLEQIDLREPTPGPGGPKISCRMFRSMARYSLILTGNTANVTQMLVCYQPPLGHSDRGADGCSLRKLVPSSGL